MTWDVIERVSTWDRVEERVLEVVDSAEEAHRRCLVLREREDRPVGATLSIRPTAT